MKAIILAAGKGTRMGSLTASLPKPMVLVQGKPVLERIIEGLRDYGKVTQFFIVTGHRGDVIQRHFENGEKWGVEITYGEQTVQDGTGKAPELAKNWVGSNSFFLSYGDILIDPTDYAHLAEHFTNDGVVAVKAGEDLTKGGAVLLDEQNWMVDLIEKSTNPPPNAYYNAGIYILTPRLFEYTSRLEKSPRGEFELTDALKTLAQNGAKLRGVKLRNHWVDVRDPEILASLNRQ